MKKSVIHNKTRCYHCGDPCSTNDIELEGKIFCCPGCKMVYELLSENSLYTYYDLQTTPGIAASNTIFKDKYSFLDDEPTKRHLLEFSNNGISKITFFIPSIHCSSCIWLLEKLYRLSPSITNSRVNFVKKQVSITFINDQISLRQVAELVASLGYEPEINLKDLDERKQGLTQKQLYIKIAIAGFAFGNSMFFSFPEYLDSLNTLSQGFKNFFAVLNIFLAIPVLFYCASGYFISSFKGIKRKVLNIDVPISLGIMALVFRSLYEIITGMGPGYFDSFNGLIFFLLLGRLFQEKTYATLSFERDYKSYFPVSVSTINGNVEKSCPISDLNVGDIVVLRNQELIPADSILLTDNATIDYSFVTGESQVVIKNKDDELYAGGRLNGSSIKIQIIKKVSQSYLTKLWNNDVFQKEESNKLSELSDKVAQYFTLSVLSIALLAGLYWINVGVGAAINVISAILIVACPCALALSIPFTFGNALRVFGKNRFYLKNIKTIERLKSISYFVFDKTGTLTVPKNPRIDFNKKLSHKESQLFKSLALNSVHPLSQHIYNFLPESKILPSTDFVEISGKGMLANINGKKIMMGSSGWIGLNPESEASSVYVSIDGNFCGKFSIQNRYRTGLKSVVKSLSKIGKIAIVSGDNTGEKIFLKNLFKNQRINGDFYFNQSPYDKQNYILSLQNSGENTLMIGDGLNDAGALKQSDVGISISDDINAFSPACDAILDANKFRQLPLFLKFAKFNYYTVIASFILSFIYNLVGLSFAVSGSLSPLVAAILMPLSSITVVAFATFTTRIYANKLGL